MTNIETPASTSSRPSRGCYAVWGDALVAARIASIFVAEISFDAVRRRNRSCKRWSTSLRPFEASDAACTARVNATDGPLSVAVRTKYMMASTRPHARLQLRAATNMVRSSALPLVMAAKAATKVSAMKRPNTISEMHSMGLNNPPPTWS